MNLINTLRMYAEDMHSATGYSERSSAMSKAADYIERLEKERDQLIQAVADHVTARGELAAQNEAIREALEEVMRWQVKNVEVWNNSAYDNAHRTRAALPYLAAEVLRKRDAETLRRAAKRFEAVDPHPKHWDWLRRMANEIDGKETT